MTSNDIKYRTVLGQRKHSWQHHFQDLTWAASEGWFPAIKWVIFYTVLCWYASRQMMVALCADIVIFPQFLPTINFLFMQKKFIECTFNLNKRIVNLRKVKITLPPEDFRTYMWGAQCGKCNLWNPVFIKFQSIKFMRHMYRYRYFRNTQLYKWYIHLFCHWLIIRSWCYLIMVQATKAYYMKGVKSFTPWSFYHTHIFNSHYRIQETK